MSTVDWSNLVLTAVLSLAAVVPAVSDLVRPLSKERTRTASILATVLSLSALGNLSVSSAARLGCEKT